MYALYMPEANRLTHNLLLVPAFLWVNTIVEDLIYWPKLLLVPAFLWVNTIKVGTKIRQLQLLVPAFLWVNTIHGH